MWCVCLAMWSLWWKHVVRKFSFFFEKKKKKPRLSEIYKAMDILAYIFPINPRWPETFRCTRGMCRR